MVADGGHVFAGRLLMGFETQRHSRAQRGGIEDAWEYGERDTVASQVGPRLCCATFQLCTSVFIHPVSTGVPRKSGTACGDATNFCLNTVQRRTWCPLEFDPCLTNSAAGSAAD